MGIDTSAILACLFDEPERARCIETINTAQIKLISLISFVEASFVLLSRKGEEGIMDLSRFLSRGAIDSVPVDTEQAELAVEAFRHFGKGRHPAALNIGDCFAYALAKARTEPLLFKGRDFALTDIVAAV